MGTVEEREGLEALPVEVVEIERLTPHPQNYKVHPEDQLEHIMESIRAHGIYRNVVVAQDYTILAGHGVVKAAKQLGRTHVPVVKVPLEPFHPRALKLLAGDNEIQHLAQVDDRALSEILKTIREGDEAGLLGTGYDDMMLANLVMVTRPSSEIENFDEAAEWVGMPEYQEGETPAKLVLSFRSEEDREELMRQIGVTKMSGNGKTWMAWWPPRERDDLSSVKFEA